MPDNIPLSQLMEAGEQIGHPNVHCQGGISLSFRSDKVRRTWQIDVIESRLQPEIAEYVSLIKSVHERLRTFDEPALPKTSILGPLDLKPCGITAEALAYMHADTRRYRSQFDFRVASNCYVAE